MDFSDKNSSSPLHTRRSANPQVSPSDEIAPGNRKMGSSGQSPEKPALKKLSSPTRSSGSKAVAPIPRKKVLAERKENFDPKVTFANSDEEEQNGFLADSSSQPYDPLTNYLSPRPKFLRYKPNRRRQILLNLDPQLAVGEEASSSSVSSSEESSLKQDDEEIEEEEEEEEEEERGNWVLRGVFKSFALFAFVALCTSYTSCMNSQTPALQAVWDMKDGFERIHEMMSEAVKNLEGSGPLLDGGFEVEEMVGVGDTDVLFVSEAEMVVEDEENRAFQSLGNVVKEEEDIFGGLDVSANAGEEIQSCCEDQMSNDLEHGNDIVSDALDVSGTEVEVEMKEEGGGDGEDMVLFDIGEVGDKIKEVSFLSEPSILIGAAIGLCTIVVSLVMASLHLNNKRRADTEKGAPSTLITNQSSCSEEKCRSVGGVPMGSCKNVSDSKEKEDLSQIEAPRTQMLGEFVEQNVQLGSCKNASKSIQSAKKDDLNQQMMTPRVQMLSEFVVSSNSTSVCSMKSRGTKTTRNAIGIEEEYGSEKKNISSSNHSSNNNTSLKVTAEKKKKRSESGKENEEEIVVLTTPVRRSSRIRSRSITSP